MWTRTEERVTWVDMTVFLLPSAAGLLIVLSLQRWTYDDGLYVNQLRKALPADTYIHMLGGCG